MIAAFIRVRRTPNRSERGLGRIVPAPTDVSSMRLLFRACSDEFWLSLVVVSGALDSSWLSSVTSERKVFSLSSNCVFSVAADGRMASFGGDGLCFATQCREKGWSPKIVPTRRVSNGVGFAWMRVKRGPRFRAIFIACFLLVFSFCSKGASRGGVKWTPSVSSWIEGLRSDRWSFLEKIRGAQERKTAVILTVLSSNWNSTKREIDT